MIPILPGRYGRMWRTAARGVPTWSLSTRRACQRSVTKTIAAKNSNYFSHGKKSEAIAMMDARKAELAQAEAI